jgi:hypothetical protein
MQDVDRLGELRYVQHAERSPGLNPDLPNARPYCVQATGGGT